MPLHASYKIKYGEIRIGSWTNPEARQTELLLLSKSESESYCNDIIGNTTLPYELWHLDDLKYESSLYLGIRHVVTMSIYWFGEVLKL